MSTVGTLNTEKTYLTENVEATLSIIVGFCLLGDETEKLYFED